MGGSLAWLVEGLGEATVERLRVDGGTVTSAREKERERRGCVHVDVVCAQRLDTPIPIPIPIPSHTPDQTRPDQTRPNQECTQSIALHTPKQHPPAMPETPSKRLLLPHHQSNTDFTTHHSSSSSPPPLLLTTILSAPFPPLSLSLSAIAPNNSFN